MHKNPDVEIWLNGPVKDVPALLQPVAHALLQAVKEAAKIMIDFNEDYLWHKPYGVASVGFHLQHLTGVLDRLFTYAKAETLSEKQLNYLNEEGIYKDGVTTKTLIANFNQQVNASLNQLSNTEETTLTQYRSVGRKQLPSTVIGLLFHAAEHTMRHVGQLMVTVKIFQPDCFELVSFKL